MGVKKNGANLAGLLALPCRIGEFSWVPPHNEEENHYVHTNWYQRLVQNFCQLFLANGHMVLLGKISSQYEGCFID